MKRQPRKNRFVGYLSSYMLYIFIAVSLFIGCGTDPEKIFYPDTTIISKPSNPSDYNSAVFSFASSRAGSTFKCDMDGGGFGDCTSPSEYTDLSDGSHTFTVRALDTMGNIDPSPASYTWAVDTSGIMPPDTSIRSLPANPSNLSSVSFGFDSTVQPSTFQCKLDSDEFSDCTSPKIYTNLKDRDHTFCVFATDSEGNPDAEPACHTWAVDTTPPVNTTSLDFINNGDAVTNDNTVTLSIAATDNVGVNGYFISGNDTGISPPPPTSDEFGWISFPAATAYSADVSYTFMGDYASGTDLHVFVWFRDTAGNVSHALSPEFSDDFESGDLDNWIIGGRQDGVNTAGVISRNGSNKAHLRHEDFTEISLGRVFNYDPDMSFSFEMETAVSSQASGTSDFYARAGVWFTFIDASDRQIGQVAYLKSTSTLPFNTNNGHCVNVFTNETCQLNRITDSGPVDYSFTVKELLDQMTLHDMVDSVIVHFVPYASGWPYDMSGDVWFDNFTLFSAANTTDSITYDTTIVIDGLVAYYPFNGNANDESGNGHHGIVNGAAASQDRFGIADSAYSFDGVDDYVEFKQTFTFHQSKDATLSFWVNRADNTHRSIFWTRGNNSDANRFNIFSGGLSWGGSGYGVGFDYRNKNGSIRPLLATTTSANQWVHIGITRSGNTYYLYVNGEYVSEITDANSDLPDYKGNWFLGRRSGYMYKGMIDDISIYNRALSESEIQELYSRQNNMNILVDSSRDGGAWWFPQAGSFDPDESHQGKRLADYLRSLGYSVTELPRPTTITHDLLASFDMVIRASEFGEYTSPEIMAYHDYLEKGGRLLLLSDHQKHVKTDSLALSLGILFEGISRGENIIDRFEPHPVTEGVSSLSYGVGSGITEFPETANILAYLSKDTYLDLNDNSIQDMVEPAGLPALGEMSFGEGKIVFGGDTNMWLGVPQPLVDNTLNWLINEFATGHQYRLDYVSGNNQTWGGGGITFPMVFKIYNLYTQSYVEKGFEGLVMSTEGDIGYDDGDKLCWSCYFPDYEDVDLTTTRGWWYVEPCSPMPPYELKLRVNAIDSISGEHIKGSPYEISHTISRTDSYCEQAQS